MQESRYKVGAKNCRPDASGHTICHDLGIAQVNVRTAKRYGLCENRLTWDMTYSVNAAAMILSDFLKKYPEDKDAWTRYNAASLDKRIVYKNLVNRWM